MKAFADFLSWRRVNRLPIYHLASLGVLLGNTAVASSLHVADTLPALSSASIAPYSATSNVERIAPAVDISAPSQQNPIVSWLVRKEVRDLKQILPNWQKSGQHIWHNSSVVKLGDIQVGVGYSTLNDMVDWSLAAMKNWLFAWSDRKPSHLTQQSAEPNWAPASSNDYHTQGFDDYAVLSQLGEMTDHATLAAIHASESANSGKRWILTLMQQIVTNPWFLVCVVCLPFMILARQLQKLGFRIRSHQ